MNCSTIENPCLTIQYAIDNVTMSGDVIKIDGSLGNFTVPREVRISTCMSLTFTSYNGLALVYREKESSLSAGYGTFMVIRSFRKKVKCKVLFNNINFHDTLLIRLEHWRFSKIWIFTPYLQDTTLTIRNCLFHFSEYAKAAQWQYSSLITMQSGSSFINMEHCRIQANYQIGIVFYPKIQWCPKFLSTQIIFRNTRIENALHSVYAKMTVCKNSKFVLRISKSTLISNGKHHSRAAQVIVDLGQLNYPKVALLVFMENSCFRNLSVESNTGAVMDIKWASKIFIRNCTFRGNVGNRGGALSIQSKLLTIVDSHFCNNHARVITLCAHRHQAGCGGAIFIGTSPVSLGLQIYNSSFINNIADCLGSAVYLGAIAAVVVKQTQLSTNFTASPSTMWFSYSKFFHVDQVSFEAKEDGKLGGELFVARANKFIFEEQSPYFKCPRASVPDVSTSKTKTNSGTATSKHVRCNYCPKGEYTLRLSNISGLNSNESIENRIESQCLPCSFGAVCKLGIRPRPNFWGYVHKNTAFMTVCPPDFCCQTSDKCITLNSCNSRRAGRLCGKCKPGYFQSFFTNDCLEEKVCKTGKFWAVALIACLVFTVILVLLKDIFLLIMNFLEKAKSVLLYVESKVDWFRKKNSFTKKSSNQLDDIVGDQEREYEDDSNDVDRREEENDEALLSEMQSEPSIGSKAEGLIEIFFFFYQINSILTVYTALREYQYLDNLKIFILGASNPNSPPCSLWKEFHCPIHEMGSTTKALIRALFPVFCLMFAVFFCAFVYALSHFFSGNDHIRKFVKKTKPRLFRAILQLILLGYSMVTSTILSLVTCISLVNGDRILYMDGDVLCYQPWQIASFVFIGVWAVPLIYATWRLPRYMGKRKIALRGVYAALFLPLLFVVYDIMRFIKEKCCVKGDDTSIYQSSTSLIDPSRKKKPDDAMSQLLDVIESPFRYKSGVEKDKKLPWMPFLLFQRLLLAVFNTIIEVPGMRSLVLLLCIIVFLCINSYIKPFNSSFLNAVNSGSFILLCITGVINTIYAFIYEYGSVPKGPLVQLLRIFDCLEFAVWPALPVAVVATAFISLCAKIAEWCWKHEPTKRKEQEAIPLPSSQGSSSFNKVLS